MRRRLMLLLVSATMATGFSPFPVGEPPKGYLDIDLVEELYLATSRLGLFDVPSPGEWRVQFRDGRWEIFSDDVATAISSKRGFIAGLDVR